MKAVSFLLAVLTLSLATVSSQPAAHAADEKADAKKKKKSDDKAKPADKKPEEKKPAEKKPDDKAKPADKKPEEKKPDDKAKPPASSKPATPPPGQSKPVEPKPVVAVEPAPAVQPLDIETLRKDRGERRKETVGRSRQLWGALLKDERGTAELRRHSFLVAALKRILAIAESKKDSQTAETVNALLAKEDERHSRKMNALRAGAGGPQ